MINGAAHIPYVRNSEVHILKRADSTGVAKASVFIIWRRSLWRGSMIVRYSKRTTSADHSLPS